MVDIVGQQRTCPRCQTANPPNMRFCGACGFQLDSKVPLASGSDEFVGTLVGNRFVILEQIGQGGMGVVYRAEQTGIWRAVALKVLRTKFSSEPKLLERFRNEASTASRLSHPNTITIYDFGVTEDGRMYIAMELVEGTNLDDEVRNSGPMDWVRTCHIAVQICASLEEAHRHNIIHRDLKPENIMLTRRGEEKDVVKVLDFGIAKILAKEGRGSGPALTAGDEIFGTPEYMAPEQIRSEPLDPRADIYALGIILYRMLTGCLPFSADAPLALLAKHLMEPPIPFDSHPASADVPGDLKTLVMSALAKDRNSRPASMRIIADQLRRFANISGSAGIPKQAVVRNVVRPAEGKRSEDPAKTDPRGAKVQPWAPAPPRPMGKTSADAPDIPSQPISQTKSDISREERAIEELLLAASAPLESGEVSEPERKSSSSIPVDVMEPEDEGDTDREELAAPGVEQLSAAGREETIKSLLARMKKSKDFPALSQNITELNTKAGRDDVSARQLSNVILKDYALTSKMLRLVNSPFYGQYRGRVMTVSRAVVILGFEQVRQMALGLIFFEKLGSKDRGQASALLDTALGSLMSGLVAKGVARNLDGINEEEALVCAIFRNFGKYLTYYYFPKESREIRRRVKKKGEESEQASRDVIGISFSELGRTIAEQWEFPEAIIEAMRPLPSGRLPKGKDKICKLRNLSGFAEELTQIAGTTRPELRKSALKSLKDRFAKNFTVSQPDLDLAVFEATKEIRDYSKILNLSFQESPFVRRVLKWSGMTEPPLPAHGMNSRPSEFPELDSLDPPPMLEEEPRPDQLEERKKILISGSEEIAIAMTSHYDLNSLIMMILETMYRGFGLSRVIFCLNDVRKDVMVARSGFGDGIETLLRSFRFKPRHGRDIFNQAVSRGADYIESNTKRPRFAEKLPAWYRRIADPPILLIYPIMVRNYPAGLFYGDQSDPKKKLNRGLLVHMDKLRNRAARAIREKGTGY